MTNTTAELGDQAPAAANDATAELDQVLAAANDATAELDQVLAAANDATAELDQVLATAELDQAAAAATDATHIVRFALGELVFEIDLMAITGPEWRDLKKLTGLHQAELMRDAIAWQDFDAQAAFVWLAARQEMPGVDYESVLGLFSYAAFAEG